MVVDEKGLLAAMKEEYKSLGYKVAADDRSGVENVIISAPLWTVVIRKEDLPRKVLGLIAEHVGEIPEAGTAYQVSKKQTQTEIFSMTMQTVKDFNIGEKDRRIIRRTDLVLGGYPIWQTATDRRVVEVNPDMEDLMNWGRHVVRLAGDDLLYVDDDVSRAYIRCSLPKDDPARLEKLAHLAKLQWVAGT